MHVHIISQSGEAKLLHRHEGGSGIKHVLGFVGKEFWETTALIERVECTAHHPGSREWLFVTMPLLSIKETLQLPLSTRAVPADDDPPLYK